MIRQYGWGPKRTTLFNKVFVLKGKRMSVVGAYGTRGLFAVDVIPETYNQARLNLKVFSNILYYLS